MKAMTRLQVSSRSRLNAATRRDDADPRTGLTDDP